MTTYNASKMAAGIQPKYLPSAGGVNVLSTIALTTPLVANDTINMVQLSADAAIQTANGPTIIGMVLDCDQLDSNGSPLVTLDVGDSNAAQRYFAASTIAQAGGYAVPSIPAVLGFQPFASSFGTYTTPSLQTYTIFITCHHASATWKNGTVRLLTEYTYDP